MLSRRLRLPADLPEPVVDPRRAAVAVVFGPDDELCFIRRAERPGDPWSGHMAFPGGRHEPADASLHETAVREAAEEVGLALGASERLGVLTPLRSPVRDPVRALTVVPYVYRVPTWPPFRLSDEVQSVHLIAARRLFGGEGRGRFRYQKDGYDLELPCVELDGTFIWGLTLRMVDELAERLGRD